MGVQEMEGLVDQVVLNSGDNAHLFDVGRTTVSVFYGELSLHGSLDLAKLAA